MDSEAAARNLGLPLARDAGLDALCRDFEVIRQVDRERIDYGYAVGYASKNRRHQVSVVAWLSEDASYTGLLNDLRDLCNPRRARFRGIGLGNPAMPIEAVCEFKVLEGIVVGDDGRVFYRS